MNKNILLNNKKFHFTKNHLPLLIHGKDHTGASLCTVTAISDLYLQGNKILFLSGYPMARDEFLTQTNSSNDFVVVDQKTKLGEVDKYKAIFIHRENADLFIKLTKVLPDINERIVLVKNINLFNKEILYTAKEFKLLILSGNIDESSYEANYIKKLKTKIFHSQPKMNLALKIPKLEKYAGYLWSEKDNGIITVVNN